MAVDLEPTAPPTSTEGHAPVPDGPAQPVTRRGWSPKRTIGGLAALALVGGVLIFGGGSDEDPAAEDAATEPPATEDPSGAVEPILSGELQDDYVVFTDPETGISLQHPESWVPLAPPEASRRLLLGAGGLSGLQVRVDPIDGKVDTPELLAQVQTTTDRIAGAPGVQVVKREPVQINGMLGISYLSRFTDEASGTKVANAQYFLFKDNTMYNLLFQAAPEEDFDRLAPEFNKVLTSFQGAPSEDVPPPSESGSE